MAPPSSPRSPEPCHCRRPPRPRSRAPLTSPPSLPHLAGRVVPPRAPQWPECLERWPVPPGHLAGARGLLFSGASVGRKKGRSKEERERDPVGPAGSDTCVDPVASVEKWRPHLHAGPTRQPLSVDPATATRISGSVLPKIRFPVEKACFGAFGYKCAFPVLKTYFRLRRFLFSLSGACL